MPATIEVSRKAIDFLVPNFEKKSHYDQGESIEKRIEWTVSDLIQELSKSLKSNGYPSPFSEFQEGFLHAIDESRSAAELISANEAFSVDEMFRNVQVLRVARDGGLSISQYYKEGYVTMLAFLVFYQQLSTIIVRENTFDLLSNIREAALGLRKN